MRSLQAVYDHPILISRTSLPEDIENAVCNAGIKLENFLYNLFWDTGAWYAVSASLAPSDAYWMILKQVLVSVCTKHL